MNAEEARAITRNNLQGPVIAPLMKVAYARIEEAAERGDSSVSHPFHGVTPWPSAAAKEEALQQLRNDGFKVEHTDFGPSPDPRETPYDTVSW